MNSALDVIRGALATAIPFNGHVGLEVVEVRPGSCSIRLPDRPELRNHLGTAHAAALFAAGEAASGGAFGAAFADLLVTGALPVVRGAEIRFRRPARGAIVATATVPDADALGAQLQADGRVDVPVEVEMRDVDDEVVATMAVAWLVKRP
jgi:acyl-coenzyme A thioesterase PaaI-like protein